MRKNKIFFLLLFCLIFESTIFFSVSQANAQGFQYQLLEKIPGAANVGSDLPGYIKAIYNLALIIIILSAVLMLSIGGFMYLTSAGNTAAMTTAKGVIYDAVIGLAIALLAWLILNVINPDLVNVNIHLFKIAAPTGIPPTGGPPPAGSGSGCGGYVTKDINVAQCGDAAQPLSDILKCMYDKFPGAQISSISANVGILACKNNHNPSTCKHGPNSCHYGGGPSKTSVECQKSYAVDFSIRDPQGDVSQALAGAIRSTASSCGGRVNDESNSTEPHIHVSAPTSCCNL